MSDSPFRPQHLFIVRLWSEASQPTISEWRGSVEHIQSGRKFYFTSLGDLNDFISFRLRQEPNPGTENQDSGNQRINS